MTPVLFVDSNVLIEALLIPESAAYVIAEMAANGAFELVTCALCVEDTEDAIIAKLQGESELVDEVVENWQKLMRDIRITIMANPDMEIVNNTYTKYLSVMRHAADIPVLAAALSMVPKPHAILSGNRKHFNDKVAEAIGIKIMSCHEFIEFISET